MAYYVSICKGGYGGPYVLAAGPFNRHGDALRCVGAVNRLVKDLYPNDRDVAWAGFGTCNVKRGPLTVGKFNARLGLPEGRISESSIDNRWWTPGENRFTELPVSRQQRHIRKARVAARKQAIREAA